MNINRSTVLILSVLSLLLVFGANANAYDGKMGKRFAKELDLTPAQQNKIEAIKQNKNEVRSKNKEKIQELKQKKRELLANYTEAKAKDIAEESAKLHKERMLDRLKMQNEIYQILDDRQKILFQAMLEKRPGHHAKNKQGKHHIKGQHHPKNCPHK